MFFGECFIVVGIVSFIGELVAWLIGYLYRQRTQARSLSLIIHMAKKGWYWNAASLDYVDKDGNRATDEQLHEALKDF